jgi:putative AlgH/UPF0301 family transcriptional regulator
MADFGPPHYNVGQSHMLNHLPEAIDLWYSPWSRYHLETEIQEPKWLSIMVQSMSTLVRDLRSTIRLETNQI